MKNHSVNNHDLKTLADALWQAEQQGKPIAPLTVQAPWLQVADAYAIQRQVAKLRMGTPEKQIDLVGHKIGLTSAAMQQMLGVDEPDYGALFSDLVLESGCELQLGQLIAPRVEPEIAFVLKKPLSGRELTVEQVLDATDYLLPALEVIDSRIADWKIGLVDTVADNASCGRIVLGTTKTSPGQIDLAVSQVDLKIDGETVQSGQGDAVLGHPAKAVAWLAGALDQFGVVLEPGQVIMPGSMTAAAPLAAGNTIVADFGQLGTVGVSCSAN